MPYMLLQVVSGNELPRITWRISSSTIHCRSHLHPDTYQNNIHLLRYREVGISPIISEGDTIGSVVLMATEASSQMGDAEIKLAQSAAGFLGKQMEE